MISPMFYYAISYRLYQTVVYATVTYRDTQDRSPLNPSYTEWDVCWPVATWYITWHAAICLSVVTLPSCLFRLEYEYFPSFLQYFGFFLSFQCVIRRVLISFAV